MSFDPLRRHTKLERNAILMLVGIIVVVLIGGLIEIVPLFRMETVIEPVKGVRPYTPLELTGQNIYIREGCYLCHSQQIRPLRDEVERYGHYSLAAESMYDHPFQWGSKRTGPDLARVGGKYSDEWHVSHLANPRDVVPESIMPTYLFLKKSGVDINKAPKHLKALRIVGVPYTDEMIESAKSDMVTQANPNSDQVDALAARYGKVNIRDFDGQPEIVSEMDALVSYLQVLGTMVQFSEENEEIITPSLNKSADPAPAPAQEKPKL